MTIRPLAPAVPFSPREASARPDAAPRAAAETAGPGPLSDAERQALAQQFPESPALTLRLYGPQRGAAETAAAIGTRLDLRG